MRLIREEKAFIREAVLLMLPMILQNFVTFSMSMADTFMVGVLGETALAAVTMANSPFYVMQLMIFGVQSGMSWSCGACGSRHAVKESRRNGLRPGGCGLNAWCAQRLAISSHSTSTPFGSAETSTQERAG